MRCGEEKQGLRKTCFLNLQFKKSKSNVLHPPPFGPTALNVSEMFCPTHLSPVGKGGRTKLPKKMCMGCFSRPTQVVRKALAGGRGLGWGRSIVVGQGEDFSTTVVCTTLHSLKVFCLSKATALWSHAVLRCDLCGHYDSGCPPHPQTLLAQKKTTKKTTLKDRRGYSVANTWK